MFNVVTVPVVQIRNRPIRYRSTSAGLRKEPKNIKLERFWRADIYETTILGYYLYRKMAFIQSST